MVDAKERRNSLFHFEGYLELDIPKQSRILCMGSFLEKIMMLDQPQSRRWFTTTPSFLCKEEKEL